LEENHVPANVAIANTMRQSIDMALERRAEYAHEYTTSVARTFDAVENLRETWMRMGCRYVDADLDFYLTVIHTRSEMKRPHVILVEKAGRPVAMLVGRLENVPLASKIGYKTLYSPVVRSISIVYGGVLGRFPPVASALALADLRRSLAAGEADIIFFPKLTLDSPLLRATQQTPFLYRGHFSKPNRHWRLNLPDSMDAYLASLSHQTRANVRRYARRLLQDFGDGAHVRVFRHKKDCDEMFADLEIVASKTYQRGLGVGFANEERHRSLISLGLDRNWFRAYVLYLANKPCAFWLGNRYAGTFATGAPGYDPAYAHYNVGTYVHMKMIEDLIDEGDIRAIDYGFGDADYKQRFGNQHWEERDVLIFASSLKGLKINAARTAILGTAQLGKRIIDRGSVGTRIKRAWRRRLTPQGREE
jgi:GNAT acetyltransferase-like protein